MSGRLILASASPRRAELLRSAGFDFDVVVADVDESVRAGERPDVYVQRLAEAKARAVSRRAPGRPVLGADTTVVVDGGILAKPADAGDARRMLRLLSGRRHDVMTGICLLGSGAPPVRSSGEPDDARPSWTEVATTTVEFAPLNPQEIDWYVASGEPLDKAGGYAVQGLASRFVTRLDGSYSNVVGLPVSLVYRMCIDAGLLLS
jgi:septum formation protein